MISRASNDKLLTLTLHHTISAFNWCSGTGAAPQKALVFDLLLSLSLSVRGD
jgi:hypothetical protein